MPNCSFYRKYELQCTSDLAPTLTATTTNLWYNMSAATGHDVVGDTEYACSVFLVLTDGRKSAHSPIDFVLTTAPKGKRAQVFANKSQICSCTAAFVITVNVNVNVYSPCVL